MEGVRFDWVGTILSCLGIGILLLGAQLAGRYGWFEARRPFPLLGQELTPLGLSVVPFTIATGFIFLVSFISWEDWRVNRKQMPLFQGSFFRSRQYTFGLLTNSMANISISGFLFVMPVFFQQIGLSGLQTGLVLFPYTCGLVVLSLSTSSLSQKISPKFIIQGGLLLMLGGVWMVYETLEPNLSMSALIPAFAVFGSGTGIVLAQTSNVPLSAVSPEESGTASGVLETTREMGIAFGIAVIGSTLMFSQLSHFTNGMLTKTQVNISEDERQEIIIELEDRLQKARTQVEEELLIVQLPEEVRVSLEQIMPSVYINAQRSSLKVVFDFLLGSFLFSAFLPTAQLHSKPDIDE